MNENERLPEFIKYRERKIEDHSFYPIDENPVELKSDIKVIDDPHMGTSSTIRSFDISASDYINECIKKTKFKEYINDPQFNESGESYNKTIEGIDSIFGKNFKPENDIQELEKELTLLTKKVNVIKSKLKNLGRSDIFYTIKLNDFNKIISLCNKRIVEINSILEEIKPSKINEDEEAIVNINELAEHYTLLELDKNFSLKNDTKLYQEIFSKHFEIISSFKRNKNG